MFMDQKGSERNNKLSGTVTRPTAGLEMPISLNWYTEE